MTITTPSNEAVSRREELLEILSKGPATDIFLAEEARAICEVIDKDSDSIAKNHLARALYVYRGYAVERFIFAVTRIFEQRKSPKYALRSLSEALVLLRDHAAELFIVEPIRLQRHLERMGAWSPEIERSSGVDRTMAIANYLLSKIPRSTEGQGKKPPGEVDLALDTLKLIRDKFLAHRENIDAESVPWVEWVKTEPMMNFAKGAVMALADGYCATSYGWIEEDYRPSTEPLATAAVVGTLVASLAYVSEREKEQFMKQFGL